MNLWQTIQLNNQAVLTASNTNTKYQIKWKDNKFDNIEYLVFSDTHTASEEPLVLMVKGLMS